MLLRQIQLHRHVRVVVALGFRCSSPVANASVSEKRAHELSERGAPLVTSLRPRCSWSMESSPIACAVVVRASAHGRLVEMPRL
eukprot:7390336-Prymnesium_polylepis.1